MNFKPSSLRKTILDMAYSGKSVHVGCAFSIVEMLSVLYSKIIDTQKIINQDSERDYVCLSKGHGAMALYACLNEMGMISDQDMKDYFTDGSPLTGLSESHTPGVEVSGGSLGQGITVATGIALGKKLDKSNSKTFCIVGDGEINEGSAWESLLICAHQKLNHFFLLIDANSFQAMGTCESVLNLEPLTNKLKAFNFETLECDGHNVADLEKCITQLMNSSSSKPKAIVARTIKGKGISFMEHDNSWHYTRLTEDTYKKAISELQK